MYDLDLFTTFILFIFFYQVQANNVSLTRQITQTVKLPPSIAAAVSSTTGGITNQMNLQQRQQNLRVQSLEMEREQLRLRQQEIMRQVYICFKFYVYT